MDNQILTEAIVTATAMSDKLKVIGLYKKAEIAKGNVPQAAEKIVDREAELLFQAHSVYVSTINLLVTHINSTEKALHKAEAQRTKQADYIRTIEGEVFTQGNKMERLMADEELSKLPINLLSRINAYLI